MSRVEGAVVVRRPDLASNIAPANSLDFVKTFQAYFSTFRSSLFPIRHGRIGVCRRNGTLDLPEEKSNEVSLGNQNL